MKLQSDQMNQNIRIPMIERQIFQKLVRWVEPSDFLDMLLTVSEMLFGASLFFYSSQKELR
jgi:hypothetical protein